MQQSSVFSLQNLATLDADLNELVRLEAIPAIVSAMRKHQKNVDIQLNGTRCLIYLSFSEENVTSMMTASITSALTANLATDKKDLVIATLYLATSIALVPSLKEALVKAGAIEKLLAAVAQYSTDDAVKDTAEELLTSVIGEEQVAQSIASFGQTLSTALESKNKADMSKLKEMANRLGALSATPEFAELMIKADGAKTLVMALESVSAKSTLPDAEGVLAACGNALTTLGAIVQENPTLAPGFLASGAVRGMISSVKAAPKLAKHVTTAIKFIDTFASNPAVVESVIEEGGIEACVAAMRANTTTNDVVTCAVNTMLSIAQTDRGAVAIAKHGGTRQVIATVSANVGTPNFQLPMEKSLALLQRVALTNEGADTLVKQGGVDAVIQATDVLTRVTAKATSSGQGTAAENDGDESSQSQASQAASGMSSTSAAQAAQLSSKLLARLMTSDDVEGAVEDLVELAKGAAAGRVPKVDIALPVVSRVAYMATVGNFADSIVKLGGAQAMSTIISVLMTKCDDSKPEDVEVKNALLPQLFKAMGSVAKTVKLDDSLGLTDYVSRAVEAKYAILESLECIRNMATHSAAAAQTLSHDGRTITIVADTLRANIRNPEIATSCFSGLAALARSPESAALVASSAALPIVSSWIDDNLEDAPTEAVEAALAALSNMAQSAPHAAAMLEGGAVELIKAVLSKLCIEAEVASPAVLAASVGMVNRLGCNAQAMGKITASGALRRVVRAVTSNTAYMHDEGCISSIIDLIRANAENPASASELAAIGAQELIVAGMNANGTSEIVLRAGAAALSALGAGEEAGRICLEEVRSLTLAVEKSSEVTEDQITHLGEAVQRLGNFMMIPGVVTATTAPALMSAVSNAVALIAESEMGKPVILAAGVQSIGRLMELGGTATQAVVGEAVNMVMDVLSLNPDSSAIRESAVHTLGTLAGNAVGLTAIYDAGGMAVISETAKLNTKDARLQGLIDSTLTKMTESASKNAAEMVSQVGGSRALAAVVQAAGADSAQLTAVLNNISAVQGGDDALYDVIAASSANSDVVNETLRVLREKSDLQGASTVRSVAGSARRIQGLSKSLQTALNVQATITATSDARTKLQALRMAENTLSLLAHMEMEADGADEFFKHSGIDSMMQLLTANAEDPETVSKIVHIMRGAMQHANPAAASTMAMPENMGTLVGLLKLYSDDPVITAEAVDIMAFTARITGADKSGIDVEGMRAVNSASSAYASNVKLQAAVGKLQSTMSSKFHEAEAAARNMTMSLAQATRALTASGTVQELLTEDGRKYYFDSATNVTTWEAPPSFTAFKEAMQAVQEAALKQSEEAVINVDHDAINCMVSALSTHVRDQHIATSAAATLSALAANAANAEAIAQSGGIKAAIAAINVNPDNIQLLKILLVLMERISRNDTFKELITASGGLEVLIDVAIPRHVAIEEIALKSLSTMANLAFNSQNNIAAIMAKGGVKAVEKSLQQWPNHPRILENAMCVLSNLMYGSEENKLTIGQTCGDEVTGVIRDHPKDVNLFKMALRALGNLAYCDENIRFIVEANSATKAIVAGMRANPKDEEALQVAMEVIGNFASLDEAPPDVDEDGNVINPKDSICMIILREAGCAEIIATMKRFPHNSSLLKAGMDALSNVANDTEVTELMARKQNIIPTAIEIMQQHDWDEELVKHAVMLLASISYCRECLPLIAQLDGIHVLLSAMEQHGSNHELLQSAQLAISNLAGDETARNTLRDMEGVRTILGIFEHNITAKGFVQEVFRTLIRLCTDDKLSSAIAQDGMHIIMSGIERYQRDPEFLTSAFRLLGHLAFVESNLTIIVQHNGIQRVIQAITEHPDYQPLIVRGIQTLDNIAMANKENAAIVIDEGGKELIEMIMAQEQYAEDDDVQRYGKSALLSMSALENLSKSAEITAKAAKASAAKKNAPVVEAARPTDPLADVRLTLSAGKIMKVWTKGSASAAHVLVSPDFKSIVWQDIKSQKKLGALDMRQVVAIRGGVGEGHKKSSSILGGKAADAELCFSVVGDRSSLDLECTTTREQKTWVDALQRLLTVYRTTPHLL
jgi:hypothetical protein